MKKLIKVAAFLGCAFIIPNAMADGCDDVTNECTPSSPFDVTNDEFELDLSYVPRDMADWPCEISGMCGNLGVESFASSHVLQFMKGMERYAEEMDAWYSATEWYQDMLYTQSKNADLTDNIAYAILDRDSKIKIDLNFSGNKSSYRPGQIISGSDWDNDGQIDMLQDAQGISFSNTVVLSVDID